MSRKIKICFVQTFTYAVFNPASKAKIGGAEVDLYNIANELIKDNQFEVYFLVADFGQKPLEIYNNIKVIKGHSQKKTLKNYLLSFFIFYKKLAQINADIYLTANLSKYVGFTNLYCRIRKKIHIHRTEHQHQVDRQYLLKKILRGSGRYFFFYLGFKNVNYIVVQNEEDRATLKRTFNLPSMVIRNSYPIRFVLELNNSLREKVCRTGKIAAKRDNVEVPIIIKLTNELLEVVGLYIAEGGKTAASFTNSWPEAINCILLFFERFFGLQRETIKASICCNTKLKNKKENPIEIKTESNKKIKKLFNSYIQFHITFFTIILILNLYNIIMWLGFFYFIIFMIWFIIFVIEVPVLAYQKEEKIGLTDLRNLCV